MHIQNRPAPSHHLSPSLKQPSIYVRTQSMHEHIYIYTYTNTYIHTTGPRRAIFSSFLKQPSIYIRTQSMHEHIYIYTYTNTYIHTNRPAPSHHYILIIIIYTHTYTCIHTKQARAEPSSLLFSATKTPMHSSSLNADDLSPDRDYQVCECMHVCVSVHVCTFM